MGFSLKLFFEELESIMATSLKPKKKLALLEKRIREGKKYADECGQLR